MTGSRQRWLALRIRRRAEAARDGGSNTAIQDLWNGVREAQRGVLPELHLTAKLESPASETGEKFGGEPESILVVLAATSVAARPLFRFIVDMFREWRLMGEKVYKVKDGEFELIVKGREQDDELKSLIERYVERRMAHEGELGGTAHAIDSPSLELVVVDAGV